MPITQGFTTLASVTFQAQGRADQLTNQFSAPNTPFPEGAPFLSPQEWNANIQQAYYEVYGILVTSYGENYYIESYQFVTDGTNYQYPLPYDFFKFLGVEIQMAPPGNTQNVTLNPFNFRNRNDFGPYPGISSAGPMAPYYRLNGNTIWFKPAPSQGLNMQLWYVPRASTLAESGTFTFNGSLIGTTITLNGVTFTMSTASDTTNATNFATAINNNLSLGPIFSASANGAVVTVAIKNINQPASMVVTGANTSIISGGVPAILSSPSTNWTNTLDGVDGWENYVIVRAAQMSLSKEESIDSWNVLNQELMGIKQRIEDAATNRNAADPATVTITGQGTARGGFGGSGYGGW